MKFQSLIVLLLITLFLAGGFFLNKYLQKSIRPRESSAKLLLYFLCFIVLIVVLSFLMVVVITRLFPGELIK